MRVHEGCGAPGGTSRPGRNPSPSRALQSAPPRRWWGGARSQRNMPWVLTCLANVRHALGVNASCGPCPCCLVSRTAMWPTTEQEPGGRPTAAPPGSAGSRSPSQGRPRHDPRRSKAVGQSTPETLPRRQRGREPRVRGVRVAVSDERGRLAMHVTDGSPLLTLIGGAETEPSDIQDCAPIRSRYPDPNYRHMRAFLT